MNRKHMGLMLAGIVCLALAVIVGVMATKNQANVLWPEGQVIKR